MSRAPTAQRGDALISSERRCAHLVCTVICDRGHQVPIEEQTLEGPLHEGIYSGHCLAGDDFFQAVMTFEQAQQWAAQHPSCEGFTFQHPDRRPVEPCRVWFKTRLRVLYCEGWWSYSLGRRM